MTHPALLADIFYREAADAGCVWTLSRDGLYPAPKNGEGLRVQPFFSSRERAEQIAATHEAFAGCEIVEVAWDDFCRDWAPDLTKDRRLVGINWTGVAKATYDMKPMTLVRNVDAVRPK